MGPSVSWVPAVVLLRGGAELSALFCRHPGGVAVTVILSADVLDESVKIKGNF